VAELDIADQEALAVIRAALPPISVYDPRVPLPLAYSHDVPVAIDCEWHSKRCTCGRPLPDGTLETIGLGNEWAIVQIDWLALNEYEQVEARADVEELVRRVPIIYQSAMADIKVLRRHGFKIDPAMHFRLEDIMLADAVLDAEEAHDLGDINRRHGRLPDWKGLQYKAPKEYNAADVLAPVLLWKHHFVPAFERDPAAEAIYRDYSIAFLTEIQLETEEAGIRVDKTRPIPLWDKYSEKKEQASRLAVAACGWPINLGSPDDMKHQL